MAQISKDTLWKGIIEDFFEEFCCYFFPEWAEQVADFSKKPEFLDQELHNLFPDGDQHGRRADKLVRVYTKDGQQQWMLIHIEIQGYRDDQFDQRMFTYFYRIRDRYEAHNLMVLAIYTDDEKGFHPKKYEYVYGSTKISYEFQTFKLLDKTETELTIPGNPFSIVMRTAKKALVRRATTDEQQLIWKTELVRELAREGYSEQKIRFLLLFIKNYVTFASVQVRDKFLEKVDQIFNKQERMGLIEYVIEEVRTNSLAEGKAEGKAEGIEITKAKGIRKALEKGKLTIEEIADLFEVSVEFVQNIAKKG